MATDKVRRTYPNRRRTRRNPAGSQPGDAEHLQAAFGIKTIGDLGRNKYFLWAQSIAELAEYARPHLQNEGRASGGCAPSAFFGLAVATPTGRHSHSNERLLQPRNHQ